VLASSNSLVRIFLFSSIRKAILLRARQPP
jgi:hypothetical protein